MSTIPKQCVNTTVQKVRMIIVVRNEYFLFIKDTFNWSKVAVKHL